jgi:hypothetical protein
MTRCRTISRSEMMKVRGLKEVLAGADDDPDMT